MRPLKNATALAGLVTQCTKALCFHVNPHSLLLVSSLKGLPRQPVLIKFSFFVILVVIVPLRYVCNQI